MERPTEHTLDAAVEIGQRRINLIWETTQAFIAISVVLCNLVVGTAVGLGYSAAKTPELLTNTLFLVVGFYFSRTNHAAIGGVLGGRKSSATNTYAGYGR